MIKNAFLSATVLMGTLLLSGCPNDIVSPRINELTFVGQAPDAPSVLIFQVDFEDPDGDLGDGVLETFINSRPSGIGLLELNSIFLFSELPLDATRGSFDFVIEVSFDEDTPAGASFEFGARLLDSSENNSSTTTINLKLE